MSEPCAAFGAGHGDQSGRCRVSEAGSDGAGGGEPVRDAGDAEAEDADGPAEDAPSVLLDDDTGVDDSPPCGRAPCPPSPPPSPQPAPAASASTAASAVPIRAGRAEPARAGPADEGEHRADRALRMGRPPERGWDVHRAFGRAPRRAV
ncbi:hypothetical protein SCA03_47610 [Streptomyces cacaoi]|uniref:Uncharacterized protein n=1 Tax=Streptomyces cacaoi TaxID=1898 RepID=A0A4Y3R8Q1_STRCI|nr:hypothetical protein SCA03_47610 [Streptomyces cacaoi]